MVWGGVELKFAKPKCSRPPNKHILAFGLDLPMVGKQPGVMCEEIIFASQKKKKRTQQSLGKPNENCGGAKQPFVPSVFDTWEAQTGCGLWGEGLRGLLPAAVVRMGFSGAEDGGFVAGCIGKGVGAKRQWVWFKVFGENPGK